MTPLVDRKYHASVLFIVIPKIKDISPRRACDCLCALNRVMEGLALMTRVDHGWSGSTISGLFVIVPDALSMCVHDHLVSLFERCAAVGIPIRAGISRGPVLCFADADGGVNFVGRAINTAARLAYAKENQGCLVAKAYESFAQDLPGCDGDRLLEESPFGVIKGKQHDGAGFECRSIGTRHLVVRERLDEDLLGRAEPTPESVAGLVVAYDLPKFSAGDESQLGKRVRSVVDVLADLKANHSSLQNGRMFFCPGGDGGIFVLENAQDQALGVATALAYKLMTESEYKAEEIGVEARVGVNAGAVLLYRSLQGTMRPSGASCFVADELTSDSATTHANIVYSEHVSEAISNGSRLTLETRFRELTPLPAGVAQGLRRYAPITVAEPGHPLRKELFGPTASWQPIKRSTEH